MAGLADMAIQMQGQINRAMAFGREATALEQACYSTSAFFEADVFSVETKRKHASLQVATLGVRVSGVIARAQAEYRESPCAGEIAEGLRKAIACLEKSAKPYL